VIHKQSKIGPEIKTIQEETDDGQEEMKAQVGSLASWIDAWLQEIKSLAERADNLF
jgi:hypothetical protein